MFSKRTREQNAVNWWNFKLRPPLVKIHENIIETITNHQDSHKIQQRFSKHN